MIQATEKQFIKVIAEIKDKTENNFHIEAMIQACSLVDESESGFIRKKLECVKTLQELEGHLNYYISHYRYELYQGLKELLQAKLSPQLFDRVHAAF